MSTNFVLRRLGHLAARAEVSYDNSKQNEIYPRDSLLLELWHASGDPSGPRCPRSHNQGEPLAIITDVAATTDFLKDIKQDSHLTNVLTHTSLRLNVDVDFFCRRRQKKGYDGLRKESSLLQGSNTMLRSASAFRGSAVGAAGPFPRACR